MSVAIAGAAGLILGFIVGLEVMRLMWMEQVEDLETRLRVLTERHERGDRS